MNGWYARKVVPASFCTETLSVGLNSGCESPASCVIVSWVRTALAFAVLVSRVFGSSFCFASFWVVGTIAGLSPSVCFGVRKFRKKFCFCCDLQAVDAMGALASVTPANYRGQAWGYFPDDQDKNFFVDNEKAPWDGKRGLRFIPGGDDCFVHVKDNPELDGIDSGEASVMFDKEWDDRNGKCKGVNCTVTGGGGGGKGKGKGDRYSAW